MIKVIFAAEPIINPLLPKGEKTYNEVVGNPLGPLIARLWWTIVIVGALALLIFLVWGGIDWLMSEGEPEKLKSARNKITHAFMGMALLAASYAIMKLAYVIFGINILNFEWPTP